MEKPQETLEETCHLDYGYVLNESERYSETEANIFADKIADVLSTDLEKAGDVVTAQENDIQIPHAFDKNYKERLLNAIREFLDTEKFDGIYQNGHDGDLQYLIKDPSVVSNAILNFATKNPNSDLGKLKARGTGLFEQAIPLICDYYFGISDVYKSIYKRSKVS